MIIPRYNCMASKSMIIWAAASRIDSGRWRVTERLEERRSQSDSGRPGVNTTTWALSLFPAAYQHWLWPAGYFSVYFVLTLNTGLIKVYQGWQYLTRLPTTLTSPQRLSTSLWPLPTTTITRRRSGQTWCLPTTQTTPTTSPQPPRLSPQVTTNWTSCSSFLSVWSFQSSRWKDKARPSSLSLSSSPPSLPLSSGDFCRLWYLRALPASGSTKSGETENLSPLSSPSF